MSKTDFRSDTLETGGAPSNTTAAFAYLLDHPLKQPILLFLGYYYTLIKTVDWHRHRDHSRSLQNLKRNATERFMVQADHISGAF